MISTPRSLFGWVEAAAWTAACLSAPPLALAQESNFKTIAEIDLGKAFGARSAWRLVATQAPEGPDPIFPDQPAPGKIRLCLQKGTAPRCAVSLHPMPERLTAAPDDLWGEARYLKIAKLIYPRGGSGPPPLLLLQTASVHAVDSGQIVFTQAFAYRPSSDSFERVYHYDTGTNNNQEVRYIAAGPLAGDIVSAVPTEHAPFSFWVTVNKLGGDGIYKPVVRFRSVTGYNDGNTLAVINSEMPNIEQRLGLWRPGSPLLLPARCPKPRLKHMELWCD